MQKTRDSRKKDLFLERIMFIKIKRMSDGRGLKENYEIKKNDSKGYTDTDYTYF